MSAIKNTSLLVVMFLAGMLLFCVGTIGSFSASSVVIDIKSLPLRIILAAVGSIFIVFCIYWEFFRKPKPPSETVVSGISSAAALAASAFFQTLDNREQRSFPVLTENCTRVRILARTIVNLVGQYQKHIEDMARRGATIEILIVDPKSQSAKYLYGANFDVYSQNAIRSLTTICAMQSKYPNNIRIKFFPYVPSVGIVCFDNVDDKISVMQVQLYFLHGAIGRDRPVFLIGRSDKWYSVFEEDFTQVWDEQDLVSINQDFLIELRKTLA